MLEDAPETAWKVWSITNCPISLYDVNAEINICGKLLIKLSNKLDFSFIKIVEAFLKDNWNIFLIWYHKVLECVFQLFSVIPQYVYLTQLKTPTLINNIFFFLSEITPVLRELRSNVDFLVFILLSQQSCCVYIWNEIEWVDIEQHTPIQREIIKDIFSLYILVTHVKHRVHEWNVLQYKQ